MTATTPHPSSPPSAAVPPAARVPSATGVPPAAARPVPLAAVVDPALLTAAVTAGHVRVQRHPQAPLAIYNYTEACTYTGAWNPVTLTCRGLIVDDDGAVLARPYPKFFNHDQPGAPALRFDAPAVVTDKADGCFPTDTTLNLWGGGTITIGEVVRKRLPVTLVGMNDRGEMAPAMVTDWHYNGRKDNWLDMEVDAPVSRQNGASGHPNRLRVTVNHHIYVNGEYRPAASIRPGDTVVTQTWAPSPEVVRLIRASLLGNGCILPSRTEPHQARYQEPHSENRAEYVEALRKALGDCASNRADTTPGYGSHMIWVGSHEYEALGILRREWYPDGGAKRIPDDLSWLDDFAVAKWLMDDGHRQQFVRQADRISFATHSFPREDIVRLGERLTELYGVSYHLVDDRGRGLALVVSSGRRQEMQTLWAAIAPHVHPSMRYKLPQAYQDVPYLEPTPGHEIVLPRRVKVLSTTAVPPTKRNFPSGREGFDITTTTNNYLARGVLVHNSLGVLYPHAGRYDIATRGSFASDQARHATALLHSRYADFAPPPGLTVLFEIIFPGNRIVLDYGGLDDLVLLGAVEIATGRTYGPEAVPDWPGPAVETLPYGTLAEALAAPPRDNREGLVVHWPDTDQRVKIKYPEYVRLHRLVTGLTARSVWELLVNGGDLDAMIEPLPDELHDWVRAVVESLTATVEARAARIEAAYGEIVAGLPDGWTRRDFAERAVTDPDRGHLFLRLDGKDYRPLLWQQVRPTADWTPHNPE